MGLEVIQRLKKEKGITTKELSNIAGIPLGTLNKILSGQTKDPKLETLKAIAKALGCTLDDFDIKEDGENSEELFSVKEHTIIEKYRTLDDYGKELIDTVLDLEYSRCSKEVEFTLAAHIDGGDFSTEQTDAISNFSELTKK